MRPLALFALVAVGCGPSGPSPAKPASPEPSGSSRVASGAASEPPSEPAPLITIPEIEARVILAEMFRDAGFRIRYDVPVELGGAIVAIDGFDPDARLGFEYRAAAELAAWSGKVPGDAGVRILVIDAADRDTVEARARAFLAAVAQPAE